MKKKTIANYNLTVDNGIHVHGENDIAIGKVLEQQLQDKQQPQEQQTQQQEQSQQSTTIPFQQQEQQTETSAPNNLQLFQYQPTNLPYYENRYIIDGCDISKGFYDFQVHISSLLNTGLKFTLESHVHHILALSHIFLVSPKRMHPDIKNIMNSNTISLLNKDLSTSYWMKEHAFTMNIFTEIMAIIKDVANKKITRTTAASKLLSFESKTKPLEFLIITSIMMMILQLPDETIQHDPKEMELINGYLHPCLSPLFHDPSNDVLFRWCDTINLEATKTAISISKRRPDNCISQLDGHEYGYNLGFGEVFFSKNSIDIGNINAVLCFQAIGRHVTFYVTKLMADGLYIMYELTSIKIPGSIDELLSYIGHLDKLLDVLHVFNDQCVNMAPEQQQEATNKKRKTISTPNYATIIESTTNYKRQCVTKHNIQ